MFSFGKDILFEFSPLIDGEPVELPTQTPTIYVYESESKPTRTAAAAGTGADQTITSWNEDEPYSRTFTIDDIDDPDTTAEWKVYTYWIAINYVLEASQQSQLELRALRIARAQAHHKGLECQSADLTAIWPSATSYASATEISDFIDAARQDIKDDLGNQGFEWSLIYRADKLKRALVFKTLTYIAQSQISEGGPQFETSAAIYQKEYTAKIDAAIFDYDSDRDGKPDSVQSSPSHFRIMR